MAVPTLVFLRHGETDWNVEGRLQGQRDIPLNDHGRQQARRNGEAIARQIPEAAGFDFVASTLGRARETMAIVRREIGLDAKSFALDKRLHEVTFGEWEGLTFPEIEARDPGWLALREAGKWGFLPPGGESYQMLANRAMTWLETVRRPTVVVAHGGIVRVLLIRLAGLDPSEAVALDIPQDKVFLWKDGSVSQF
jgi:broad specificity phosphatase PhoE